MSKLKEQQLLDLMRSGDEEAFKKIYQDHRSAFISWIQKEYPEVNNENTAELYQDTMLLFHRKVMEGLVLTSSIKTYVFAISKFKIKELRRARKKLLLIDNIDSLSLETSSDEQEFEEDDTVNLISQHLKQLGSSCKKILEDFYLRGMTMKEIANEFEYSSEKVARSRKHKCLNRLKELMNKPK